VCFVLSYTVSFLLLLSINETNRTHALGRAVWLVFGIPAPLEGMVAGRPRPLSLSLAVPRRLRTRLVFFLYAVFIHSHIRQLFDPSSDCKLGFLFLPVRKKEFFRSRFLTDRPTSVSPRSWEQHIERSNASSGRIPRHNPPSAPSLRSPPQR